MLISDKTLALLSLNLLPLQAFGSTQLNQISSIAFTKSGGYCEVWGTTVADSAATLMVGKQDRILGTADAKSSCAIAKF
jgi:hypothetical protein